MRSSSTKEVLRRWALEEGFDYVAFAPLEASRHRDPLQSWLDRGDQAQMSYMERRLEDRLDSRRLVDGAESVLCVALRYHPLAGEPSVEGDLWPYVARYARGLDYHHVMKGQLDRLAERIETVYPGAPLRSYVDTGPILERELAEMAGMGAVGKNTNLLHPEGGSWLLLGELFLTLDLDTDPAVSDLCGSCTQCLEACPTGALPEPYRLDSRRCISYWTIEHRGAIPMDTRSILGRWVFGCDICQEVCPFNESPAQADHPEMRLPPERDKIDLVSLLLISREDYVAAFRGSPMKRAKQLGLQRNAAIAMGNSRNSQYLPALDAALHSHQQILRSHAAWAIGQIGGLQATDSLERRISEEEDASVLSELRLALATCRESELSKPPND